MKSVWGSTWRTICDFCKYWVGIIRAGTYDLQKPHVQTCMCAVSKWGGGCNCGGWGGGYGESGSCLTRAACGGERAGRCGVCAGGGVEGSEPDPVDPPLPFRWPWGQVSGCHYFLLNVGWVALPGINVKTASSYLTCPMTGVLTNKQYLIK